MKNETKIIKLFIRPWMISLMIFNVISLGCDESVDPQSGKDDSNITKVIEKLKPRKKDIWEKASDDGAISGLKLVTQRKIYLDEISENPDDRKTVVKYYLDAKNGYSYKNIDPATHMVHFRWGRKRRTYGGNKYCGIAVNIDVEDPPKWVKLDKPWNDDDPTGVIIPKFTPLYASWNNFKGFDVYRKGGTFRKRGKYIFSYVHGTFEYTDAKSISFHAFRKWNKDQIVQWYCAAREEGVTLSPNVGLLRNHFGQTFNIYFRDQQ